MIVRAAAALGFVKVRLTGGEPLLRPDLPEIISRTAAVPGIEDVALTTDGQLLAEQAETLRRAGLRRVNVSLDSRNPYTYARMTGGGELQRVWEGLAAAEQAGLGPVKLDVVVLRGINHHEIPALADLTTANSWQVRFIEYLPVARRECARHYPLQEIKRALFSLGDLAPVASRGLADVYHLPLALGTVGLIGWDAAAGCLRCNRVHVSADGHAYGCLFDAAPVDLRPALWDVEFVARLLSEVIRHKPPHRPALPGDLSPLRKLGG